MKTGIELFFIRKNVQGIPIEHGITSIPSKVQENYIKELHIFDINCISS